MALTHSSADILRRLGIWAAFRPDEVSPLNQARVTNGNSPFALDFEPAGSGRTQLGFLVPNHEIRRAAFEVAMSHADARLIDGTGVVDLRSRTTCAEVDLADGRRLRAPLVVAADSRFSANRRRMGIGAQMLDFGRTVIVARLSHEQPNQGIAHECFRFGGTLAMLPLNGGRSSAVITVPADKAPALLAMSPEAFAAEVRHWFDDRLGSMRLEGERHTYPLVAVYAHRFVADRFALLGDAAVGMHPVTAHGFNFGLYGVDSLTRAIARVGDPGDASALARYQAEHRRATLPIYLGTNAIVRLFTDDRLPASFARDALLRIADRFGPVKRQITRQLTGSLRAV
ncbi:MAG: 5-demethoxyubiquinol-8 5-hydroxylase UbiM [Burkholderiaceae bacterium]